MGERGVFKTFQRVVDSTFRENDSVASRLIRKARLCGPIRIRHLAANYIFTFDQRVRNSADKTLAKLVNYKREVAHAPTDSFRCPRSLHLSFT